MVHNAPPPPPDTIFQGTVTISGTRVRLRQARYGFIRIDHSQNGVVFVREQDAPDGYLTAGDRCEFSIVEDAKVEPIGTARGASGRPWTSSASSGRLRSRIPPTKLLERMYSPTPPPCPLPMS